MENFTYQATLNYFVTVGLFALVFAFITVAFHRSINTHYAGHTSLPLPKPAQSNAKAIVT